jgi:hypothetical protein
MEMIITVITFFLLLLSGVGMFIGLDLKKWTNWLFGLPGLFIGLLGGFSRNDLQGGFGLGLIFTTLILYVGAMNRWHRQRYQNIAESLLSKYGPDQRVSFLAGVIKKLRRE